MTHEAIQEFSRSRILRDVLDVLASERHAIQRIENRIDDGIADVVSVLKECSGHIIVSGIGKSGMIGRKIAASLSSTGTPAIFLHAAEACHGDLGCVRKCDVLLALSASGETTELIQVVAAVKRMGNTVVSMTGSAESTLARLSNFVVDVGIDHESDPFDCVPTASTIAMLAMGDALTVALLKERHFTRDNFAELHPGGSLGRRLLWRVSELMHKGHRIPLTIQTSTVSVAMLEMTQKRLGATFVIDQDGKFRGVFTDGDLRRLLQATSNPLEMKVADVMTRAAHSITGDRLGSEALEVMEENSITVLPVLDAGGSPVGAVHLHDLARAGFC